MSTKNTKNPVVVVSRALGESSIPTIVSGDDSMVTVTFTNDEDKTEQNTTMALNIITTAFTHNGLLFESVDLSPGFLSITIHKD